MNPIQFLIIAFAVFAAAKAVWQFKQGALTLVWLFFWFVFWGAVVVVSLLPSVADVLAEAVGVGRGADLVIYVSIIALFYLCFRLYTKIESVEQEITRLVRTLALDDIDDSHET